MNTNEHCTPASLAVRSFTPDQLQKIDEAEARYRAAVKFERAEKRLAMWVEFSQEETARLARLANEARAEYEAASGQTLFPQGAA